MIDFDIDRQRLVAHVRPSGPLSENDFRNLAQAIDPVIEEYGTLNGLLIETEHFPGWESFGSLVHHLAFVRDHHTHRRRVALVTDATLGAIAEKIGAHFLAAEIRKFPAGEVEKAQASLVSFGRGVR